MTWPEMLLLLAAAVAIIHVLVMSALWVYRCWRDKYGQVLRVTRNLDQEGSNDWEMGVPHPLTEEHRQQSPKMMSGVQIRCWLFDKHDAFPLGEWDLPLIVASLSRQSVVITSSAAIVCHREPSPLAAVVTNPPGGALEPFRVRFDLTKGDHVTGVSGTDQGGPTGRALLEIGPRANEALLITSTAGPEKVSWRIQFTYNTDQATARTYLYPPTSEPPLVTCGYNRDDAEQHWLTGIACPQWPYLRLEQPEDRGEEPPAARRSARPAEPG